MGWRRRNNRLNMTTSYSRQPDCAQRDHKMATASTFNFTSQTVSSICSVAFTKREKSDAIIFKSRYSRTIVGYRLDMPYALPLSPLRFSRFANCSPMVTRSPARRSRNGREATDKTSGEMSRVMSAQLPSNSRKVAVAIPLDDRRDNSQDNLRCAGLGRAMAVQETCETTRNLAAQRSMQYLASCSPESHRQLLAMTL
jgi:hypothetical protein